MIPIRRNLDSHYRKVLRNLNKKLSKAEKVLANANNPEAFEEALLRRDSIKDDIMELEEELYPLK